MERRAGDLAAVWTERVGVSERMTVNWKKWGLGFSIQFGDPAYLRIWLGPVRLGVRWGRE